MDRKKKLTWDDIRENNELLVKMWNTFIYADSKMNKETMSYGDKYLKIYPLTYEGIAEAYDNDFRKFIVDNKSFWGGNNGPELFSSDWLCLDISGSEEEFITSDNEAIYLIATIIQRNFIEGQNSPTMARFRRYCIKHQDEFTQNNKNMQN
ncbi:MAG: hypothetical protein K6G44_15620 [Lentisphaeria bacterium]|nr:hypothetical protein [Lentisphaeria bacterium]